MKTAMMIATSLVATACVSAKDLRSSGKVHTLGYYTGSKATGAYDERFKDGADKACNGKGYTVKEKSAHPSTLADSPGLLESDRFYWVIECN